MRTLKTVFLTVAILLALVLCILIVQSIISPDAPEVPKDLSLEDTEALTAAISEYGRGGYAVELYSWVEFDGTVYYLAELSGQLGYARLSKGQNGGYQLDELGRGTGDFREMIFGLNGTKYLLMGGRNKEPRIAKITAAIDGIVYEFTVDDTADHYFFCVELDPQPSSSDLNRGNVFFYDREGNDVTDSYVLTGGGFNPPGI